MKKLIVKIADDGQTTIEAEGFKGSACLEASKRYIEGLGRESSSQKKPEFYEQSEIVAGM